MRRLILQKIKNRIWLSASLALGITFLVAAAVSLPMFQNGSLDKYLEQSFEAYIDEYNIHPATLHRTEDYRKSKGYTIGSVMDLQNEYADSWEKALDGSIDITDRQLMVACRTMAGQPAYAEGANYVDVATMDGLLDHINIVKGEDYDSSNVSDAYPCIISLKSMDRHNYCIGEEISFSEFTDSAGKPLRLVIVGVFDLSDYTDTYFFANPMDDEKKVFVSKEDLSEIFDTYSTDGDCKVEASYAMMLDYTKIESQMVDGTLESLESFSDEDEFFEDTMSGTLSKFADKRGSISAMIWVLELPVLGMVLAFIYMVAGRIVEAESGEIAMLKSRGFSKGQILKQYLMQSTVLGAAGYVVGIPFGYLICKLSASTTDFLSFFGNPTDRYRFVAPMLLYGLVAMVVGIVFVLIPVVLKSNISIVQQKSNDKLSSKFSWVKYVVAVVALGVSVYLWYANQKDLNGLRQRALNGASMDPVVFLDSLLFIIALGFIIFMLILYLVKLIYKIGREKWDPIAYTSFLQITRTFHKQGFISVFIILTVAFGLFNANIARTINRNYEERIDYNIGSDVAFTQEWECKIYMMPDRSLRYDWKEPSMAQYDSLITDGICDNVCRVLKYENSQVVVNHKDKYNECLIMGIDTDEFGRAAKLKDELNTRGHWYNQLNTLAQQADGVIVSSNVLKDMNLEIGDFVTVYGTQEGKVDENYEVMLQIVDVVDNFPGYDRYVYREGEDKEIEVEQYLFVGNLNYMTDSLSIIPYEVWCDLADGASQSDLAEALSEKEINVTTYRSAEQETAKMKQTPDIQITNGLYTLGFIIDIIVCAIGFLIYWITSIRQREFIFGVYRAMGVPVKGVYRMLILEHIFSTLLTVIAGGIVGMITTFMFIRTFGVVYLPKKSNLDIYLFYKVGDFIKLFGIVAAIIIICLFVLREIIKRLNITQALKLGED